MSMRCRKTVAAILGCAGLVCALPVLSLARDASRDAPVRISAKVDRKNPGIGERIRYTVRVATRRDIEVEPPSLKNLGDFELNDFSVRTAHFFGKKSVSLHYVISAFEPGMRTIPAFAIKYRLPGRKEWSQVMTSELQVQIRSLVPASQEPLDIRDIKGPVGLPVTLPWKLFLWLVLAVAAGCALYVLYAYIDKAHTRSFPEVPERFAHEIAYERLEALKNKGLMRKGMIKEYYSEISDIVRQYLERRFSLKAPEMTTEEFFAYARDCRLLRPEHKDMLKDFLTSCDLVKFAKFVPPLKDSDAAFEAARRFVDETREEKDSHEL